MLTAAPPHPRGGQGQQRRAPSPMKPCRGLHLLELLHCGNPAPRGVVVFGVWGFYFEHLKRSVPRVSGITWDLGGWSAGGTQRDHPPPSLARFPMRPVGARRHRRRNHPWNRIFFLFFFPPHTGNQRSVSGHSAGRGWRGRSLPSLPVCVPCLSVAAAASLECRFLTGCTVQGMSTEGLRRGPHQPDLRV